MDEAKFIITASPHIKKNIGVNKIMACVILALAPAAAASFFLFGPGALAHIAVSIISCVCFEALFQKIIKKPVTANDFSAVVTGTLLAFTLPPSVPYWMPVIGAFFAIVIVKQLFGGLGQNFMNPALAARAFLQTAYPDRMMNWPAPNGFSGADAVTSATSGADAVTSATPLSALKFAPVPPAAKDYIDALLGNISGGLGETCAIALIIGGLFLIIIKVVSWRIPFSFILSFLLFSWIFGRGSMFGGYPVYELLLGGAMLGAFFMATDYSTSPVTPRGKLIFGAGCGFFSVLIRVYGGYPEGVNYAILLMNLATPLLDKYTKPAVFGAKFKRSKVE